MKTATQIQIEHDYKNMPSLEDAIKFRMEQYGHNQSQACKIMGISKTHFSELLKGKRKISRGQLEPLYKYGIPMRVLMHNL